MKIKTTQALLKETEKACSFASAKSASGITSCILLVAEDDHLTIRATDGKASFTSTIPASVEASGSVAVYADKLLSTLKNMPKTDIVLETKESMLKVVPEGSMKVNVGIRTSDPSRFPEEETKSEVKASFTVKSSDFIKLAASVSFAVGADVSRAFFTGVYMEAVDETLYLVATDGKRLAYAKEEGFSDFNGVIIPVRFFQSLPNSMGENMTVSITDGFIFAESDGTTISSSLIGGSYPNWRRVIPKNPTHSLRTKNQDLEVALNLSSVMSDAKTKTVFLEADKDMLLVSGEDANYGHSQQIIPCDYEGEKVSARFNNMLFPSCLKSIGARDILVRFSDGKSAWTFEPVGDESLLYVIMPMSV